MRLPLHTATDWRAARYMSIDHAPIEWAEARSTWKRLANAKPSGWERSEDESTTKLPVHKEPWAMNNPKRIDVKVTLSCGDYWVTGINATLDEARAYYIGKRFVRADESLGSPVVSVELVGEAKP